MKIAFIGGGNMAEAMLSAIIGKSIALPSDIMSSDIAEERRKYLEQKYKIAVTDNNQQAVVDSDIIILAIKPQNLNDVMKDLNSVLKPEQMVLSIIAGAGINKLSTSLGYKNIVRSMPNTPAQIGDGMTVWTATSEVTEIQKKQAATILGAMGKEIFVSDEKYLDMATAVSGSGPAYYFLLTEALATAAAEIGLPSDIADELVLQTFIGAAHLLRESGKSPAELRRMVTSPGGTTAAALQQFEDGGFSRLVSKAVEAAHKRAMELGS